MGYETIEIEAKDAGRVHMLTGSVTSIDSNIVDVDIDDYGVVSDIPVFYHCPDSETADGNPFFIDARVIIVNSGDAVSLSVADMKVVGFEDGLPNSCYWKEEWGESICENHQWYVQNYNNTESGLCLDPLPEEFSIIGGIVNCDPSAIIVGWNVERSPNINWGSAWGEPKIRANRYLTLKIATHYNCTYCGPMFVDSTIAMLINTDTQWLQLNFEETTGHPHQSREYYIGDNGGLEQVIDLHSYGLIGSSIRSIKFWVDLQYPTGAKESGGFELDYVRLSNSSA